ncbi:unnamed protein product, partial [Closterium sp. NIES-54]
VRYSSPATAALSRLMLPYLFPDLAAFATVADLITHLRTSDARYRLSHPSRRAIARSDHASTHYSITRLPHSLASVRDHFLSLCPTELTVDLLEERLGAAEKSILAVGASRGDRRTPFFEGCSPIPLLPSVASAAAVNLVGTEEVEAASAPSGRHRNSKGKGSNGSGGDGGGGGGGGGRGRGGGSGGGGGAKSGGFSGIEAAALGASAFAAPGAGESALSGTAPTEALHTFTLDSGASRSFFRDSTTLTPLSRPIAVSLADPSGGPVLAHSSTRVTHCTCSRTGRHLATFTRRPGSSLYTLNTGSPPVTMSGQVVASSQVFAATSTSSPASAPCSCRPLSHETLLWHHRLGHPSLPRLRGMASRTLVSGLPRSLPPLPPGPAPTCAPCVEGRQCAAPNSST